MKNKKGFTLVELLAVIAILGIIMTISVIAVTGTIDRSSERAHETLNSEIYEAAKRCVVENIEDFSICKSLNSLISNGYLQNVDTSKISAEISIDTTNGNYKYTITSTYKEPNEEKNEKNTITRTY